jgi:hypothetical protein
MERCVLRFDLRDDMPIKNALGTDSYRMDAFGFDESLDQASLIALSSMLDLMQQELDFSRGEALTLASLTVDLIRRPAFTYRSSSVPGKPRCRRSAFLRQSDRWTEIDPRKRRRVETSVASGCINAARLIVTNPAFATGLLLEALFRADYTAPDRFRPNKPAIVAVIQRSSQRASLAVNLATTDRA